MTNTPISRNYKTWTREEEQRLIKRWKEMHKTTKAPFSQIGKMLSFEFQRSGAALVTKFYSLGGSQIIREEIIGEETPQSTQEQSSEPEEEKNAVTNLTHGVMNAVSEFIKVNAENLISENKRLHEQNTALMDKLNSVNYKEKGNWGKGLIDIARNLSHPKYQGKGGEENA